HARLERPVDGQVREALRGARRGSTRSGATVRGRGARGALSRAGAFVSQMSDLSRRDVLALLGAAALTPLTRSGWRGPSRDAAGPGFRIRTITAGITLRNPADMEGPGAAPAFLQRAKRTVRDAGDEVQAPRNSHQPFRAVTGPP